MKVKTIEDKHEGTLVIDTNTGEILYQKKPKKVKLGSFDKYVGVDVKFASDCITKDSLIESLSVVDGYVKSKDSLYLTSHNLLDALNQELLSPLEIKLMTYIINNLTGWNIYIGTVKDLLKCGVSEGNLSRLIKGLTPNVLRVTHRNKPDRGDIVIEISPIYGWKGDVRYRDSRTNSWYSVCSDVAE